MYVNVVSFQTVKSTRGHLHLKSLSSEVQFTVRIIDINVDTQMLKEKSFQLKRPKINKEGGLCKVCLSG